MQSKTRVLQRIFWAKWKFAAVFVLVFGASFVVLAHLDLLPEEESSIREVRERTSSVSISYAAPSEEEPAVTEPEMPVRIEASKVGMSVPVNNPASRDIATLDAALNSGSVRYPTSAKLNELGNIVVFGHSSHLPIVRNESFKAFNGIEKLVPGDTVSVFSETTEYTYEVTRVYEADADTAVIPLTKDSKKLTLSTCNSFGDLDDRFVVEAEFVGSHMRST